MAKKDAIVKKEPAALALSEAEQELALEARNESAKETLGTPRITHQGGVLKIDNQPVKENKLKLVVIDYVFTKEYYEGEYDAGTPQTPVCYAMARSEPGMKPHESAPNKQNADCDSCQWNRFGTALRGGGKRCKDTRRLMTIIETDDPRSIAKAEVRQISVPPGSLKPWGNYLGALREVTPTGNVRTVITEISTQPFKGAYQLTFKPIAKLAKEFIEGILLRKQSVEAALFAPFPNIQTAEKAKPSNQKRAGKFAR